MDNNNNNNDDNNEEPQEANQLLGEMWEQGQNPNENADIEMDEGDDGNGILDGGVAVNPDNPSSSSGKRQSSDCDLVLYLACEEVFFIATNHPILKPGVTVSIGLDKNTKLSAVFHQFVEFCNESSKDRIYVADLEFVHCQVLHSSDTAETSALMKNDRIKVRAIRTAERNDESERKRMQRSADANYFMQLRHLMPDLGAKYADIVLDCQGTLLDESGRNQQVLSTHVRAHSAILSKRCPWLGAIIQKARSEAEQKKLVRVTPEFRDSSEHACRVESEGKTADEEEKEQDEDDKSIEVMPVQPNNNNNEEEESTGSSGANEIENYDEEEEDKPFDEPRDAVDPEISESPIFSPEQQKQRANPDKHLLWVTLRNHSPEAVKLLLEYCYTNRVTVLGKDAFVTACTVQPSKHKGPVPPYHNSTSGSRRWPQEGNPLVSFPVALAGIALAEEASMHRLSLMCEVAAAKIVATANVVEALSMCTTQKTKSENDLPRLRKATMDIVLRSGSRGVAELGRSPAFRRALEERRAKIIPTLLQGTTEAVSRYKKRGSLKDKPTVSNQNYDELDREDSFKRERERRKRRMEHKGSQEHAYDEAIYDDPTALWASLNAKRSLKRMSRHLEGMRATQRSFRGRKTVVSRSSDL